MALGQVNFSELGAEEPAAGEESLAGVKALTAKLKLQTRRPSYLEWEARVRGQPWGSPTPRGAKGTSGQPGAERDGSVCGFPGMEEALQWLRMELQELQAADQRLAQQLMRLRAQLNRLKVEQVCHRHKEMLDDDSDLLCTIPPKAAFLLSMPLKHIGVTRMNINSRRFSLC
uniref:Family with sequence similarity 167 member B n=1 Tax=Coturnix japonica TaxID=93934 RepID=A0A8C2SMN9_COTJA